MRLKLMGLVATVLIMAQPAGAAGWQAGTARANITPEESIWMGGFAFRDHPSEGVLQQIWAKALALRAPDGQTGVIITIDVCGIDRDFSLRVREAIEKAHGINRAGIVLACSHTHCGPVVGRNLIGTYPLEASHREVIARYTNRLEAALIETAGKAIESLAPATLGWGQGHCDFAVNRRNNAWGANVLERRDGLALEGPVDHDVPVFAAHDAAGKLMAVICIYACHTSALRPYLINGDYAGYAQVALESKHPGAQAMYVAGCGGDQGAFPRLQVKLAEKYGNQLADAVNQVLAGGLRPIGEGWTQTYEEIPLAFGAIHDRDGWVKEQELPELGAKNRAKAMIAAIDRGETLPTTYPYPIQLWRFGPDLHWFFLGGEVTVGYAQRIKRNLGGSRTFVAAYSNDVMGYIPTRVVLDEGGYEADRSMWYYGLPASWSEQVEEQVISGVRSALSRGGPHPSLIESSIP